MEQLRLESMKLLREWSVWIVGIQTGLVGLLVSLLLENKMKLGSFYIKGAVISFGVSIAIIAFTLVCIPSITERLSSDKKPIYSMAVLDFPIIRKLPLGFFVLSEYLFLLLDWRF